MRTYRHRASIYVCIYIYMYAHIYIYMYTYPYVFIYTSISICVPTHIHIYIYIHVCICAYIEGLKRPVEDSRRLPLGFKTVASRTPGLEPCKGYELRW